MADSTAHAHWTGTLLEGSGTVETETFGELPVSWATRTERVAGKTSPEELIAAAHAACYAMAFSAALAEAGSTAESLDVNAVCSFTPKSGGGFEISAVALTVTGVVPGLDQAEFERLAVEGEKGCPVSGALRGNVDIALTATLD
jgi:osmotically inducible protein OsmC